MPNWLIWLDILWYIAYRKWNILYCIVATLNLFRWFRHTALFHWVNMCVTTIFNSMIPPAGVTFVSWCNITLQEIIIEFDILKCHIGLMLLCAYHSNQNPMWNYTVSRGIEYNMYQGSNNGIEGNHIKWKRCVIAQLSMIIAMEYTYMLALYWSTLYTAVHHT